jgi:hypothetical protein
MNTNKAKQLRDQRQALGLTLLGLPRGYRNNPALLQMLVEEPKRGLSQRNPANWVEKECLYCGALVFLKRRIFCSVQCRHSYQFRQKHPLLAVKE